KIPEEEAANVLPPAVARRAGAMKKRALKEDLEAPLLEVVGLQDVLRAAVRLGVVALYGDEAERLRRIRNRSPHAVLTPDGKREEGAELIWALRRCREVRNGVQDPCRR